MNQSIGGVLNLLLSILGLIGGISGCLAVWQSAKDRGAKDQRIQNLEERVNKLEVRDDQLYMMVVDIKAGIARIEGAMGLKSVQQ